MAGGVVSIGRRKFAVGLYWQPSPSGRVAQAAREAARQQGQPADYFAVRGATKSGRVAQFGLGQKSYGHRQGMPTGAASMADQQPGSWVGAFRLDEGYWVCVVRDDLIAPDGDHLYADEREARERLMHEIGLGGLQRIYAPDSWTIPGADPVPLSLLLQGRSSGILRPVTIPRNIILFVLLGVLVVGGLAYAGLQWQRERDAAQVALERRNSQKAREQRLREGLQTVPSTLLPQANLPEPPKRVWEDAPSPEIFMTACREAMKNVPVVMAGWNLATFSCAGRTLSVEWSRTSGVAIVPPNARMDDSQSRANSQFTLENLTRRGTEVILNKDDVTQIALRRNWRAALKPVVEPPPPPPRQGQPAPPPPPPWVKRKVTLNSDTAPWHQWQGYAGLPGFVIESISWSNGSWKTEGVIYEMR